jgi:radical SAM protein with 4Fe4S-binding SPASM domain
MIKAVWSVPYFLQLELTYACNSRCVFCYNSTRQRHPPVEQTWRILRAVREAEVPLVQLTGGEVTLLPQLNEFADHLAQTSKVSIVTNAIKRRNLTNSISKIFLSLHGNRATHEKVTANPGTYDSVLDTIRYYVGQGFAVAADVLLCSANYDQMYELIGTAASLGMCEVYLNRFQGGGFGVEQLNALMPTVAQFREALGQILAARSDFGVNIAFGTSIPLCIDERLVDERLDFDCEMGTKFASIAPDGRLRLCNQALKHYGNVLETPLEILWRDPALDEYRDMRWVTGVCAECPLLDRCGAGCRVDNSQPVDYCPDAFVRDLERRPELVNEIVKSDLGRRPPELIEVSPRTGQRRLKAEDGLLIIRKHPEKYLVRRNYSALVVDECCADLCDECLDGFRNERQLWQAMQALGHHTNDERLLGRYIDHLVAAGVLIEDSSAGPG